MKIINVVYPIEPGFIWLLRQNGLWGGWRDGSLLINGGRLVSIISFRKCREEYRTFFYQIQPRENGTRWRPVIEVPEAEHFDLWGLPQKNLHPLEAEHLGMIVNCGIQKILEPLTLPV